MGRAVSVFLAATAVLIATSVTAAAEPMAYVTHQSDQITVIDTATMQPVRSFKIRDALGLTDLAVSPDGSRLWVASTARIGPMIFIVDTSNGRARTREIFRGGSYVQAGALAFAPDGQHVYVSDEFYSRVIDFDERGNELGPIGLNAASRGPCDVAVTPNSERVFATNCDASSVSMIERTKKNAVSQISVGKQPSDVVAHANRVFVVVGTPAQLAIIEQPDNSVSNVPIPGDGSAALAVSPDGSKAYVTEKTGLTVLDLAAKAVTGKIALPGSPEDIAITPNGKHAYVTGGSSNSIWVIDLATNSVASTIQVAARPFQIAISPKP